MLVWQRIVIITTSRNSIRHFSCLRCCCCRCRWITCNEYAQLRKCTCIWRWRVRLPNRAIAPNRHIQPIQRHTSTWNGLIALQIFLCICAVFVFLFYFFFAWHVSEMWKDKYLSKFASPNVLHMHRHYYAFDMCMRGTKEICCARTVIHARCRWRANEAIQTQTQSIFSSSKTDWDSLESLRSLLRSVVSRWRRNRKRQMTTQ